ncbi:hypothetical protein YC2023_098473 [Brassica napus]
MVYDLSTKVANLEFGKNQLPNISTDLPPTTEDDPSFHSPITSQYAIQHYKSLDHKYPNHKSVDHKSHEHKSPEHTTTLNTSPGHNSPDHKFVDQNYPHYTSLILTSPNHQSHILKSHLSTSLDRTSADPQHQSTKNLQPCSATYDNSAHPNSPMHHLLFQGVEIFEPIGHDPPSKVKPIYDSSTHHVSPKPALFPFPPQPITSTPLPQKIADFLNMINQSTLLINHHIKA